MELHHSTRLVVKSEKLFSDSALPSMAISITRGYPAFALPSSASASSFPMAVDMFVHKAFMSRKGIAVKSFRVIGTPERCLAWIPTDLDSPNGWRQKTATIPDKLGNRRDPSGCLKTRPATMPEISDHTLFSGFLRWWRRLTAWRHRLSVKVSTNAQIGVFRLFLRDFRLSYVGFC
jgi:hypothetical protein